MVKTLEVKHEAFFQFLSYHLLFISYLKACKSTSKKEKSYNIYWLYMFAHK